MPKTIVVMRHPEYMADGTTVAVDEISSHGVTQAWAMAAKLREMGYHTFTNLAYSGLRRTRQAIRIVATALDINMAILLQPEFDSTPTLKRTVNNLAGFRNEVAGLKARYGGRTLTVAMALQYSEYAHQGREIVTAGLLEISRTMINGETALALSHSWWAELAAVNPDFMLYGTLGPMDAIKYVVNDNLITSSDLIEAPRDDRHT